MPPLHIYNTKNINKVQGKGGEEVEYRKYEKYYVMLKADQIKRQEISEGDTNQENKGACIGNLRIETGNEKGAMKVNVENLTVYDRNYYIYKLLLFGNKNEKVIYTTMGTVLLNKYGNGEGYFRFLPKDVDGKGHELADFSHIVVAAFSFRDSKEPLHPVLKGNIEWPFQKEQKIACGEEIGRLEKDQGEEEFSCESETNVLDREDDKAKLDTIERNRLDNYNNYYNEYLVGALGMLSNKKESYEELLPFEKDKCQATWYKISRMSALPIVSPGAHYLTNKYRHFILGIERFDQNNSDRKGDYYIGIPGRYMKSEQPEEGRSGFVFWQPLFGARAQAKTGYENIYGYWIIKIDAKTGKIYSL